MQRRDQIHAQMPSSPAHPTLAPNTNGLLMAQPNAQTRSNPRSDAKLASPSNLGTKHQWFFYGAAECDDWIRSNVKSNARQIRRFQLEGLP
jgi:hypothetical protein